MAFYECEFLLGDDLNFACSQVDMLGGPYEVTKVSLDVLSHSSITSMELHFTQDGTFTDMISSTMVSSSTFESTGFIVQSKVSWFSVVSYLNFSYLLHEFAVLIPQVLFHVYRNLFVVEVQPILCLNVTLPME